MDSDIFALCIALKPVMKCVLTSVKMWLYQEYYRYCCQGFDSLPGSLDLAYKVIVSWWMKVKAVTQRNDKSTLHCLCCIITVHIHYF